MYMCVYLCMCVCVREKQRLDLFAFKYFSYVWWHVKVNIHTFLLTSCTERACVSVNSPSNCVCLPFRSETRLWRSTATRRTESNTPRLLNSLRVEDRGSLFSSNAQMPALVSDTNWILFQSRLSGCCQSSNPVFRCLPIPKIQHSSYWDFYLAVLQIDATLKNKK